MTTTVQLSLLPIGIALFSVGLVLAIGCVCSAVLQVVDQLAGVEVEG